MYDALVLAGGSSSRLGGSDKTQLLVAGRTMLDRVLAATAAADVTVVVGPDLPTGRPVRFAREDPVGGGPAAALAAGLPYVTAPVVVVVAADLPFLDEATVERLAAAAPAVLVDDAGRDQWLCGAWPVELLRRQVTGPQHDARLRDLLRPLDPVRLTVPGTPWADVDTPDDLRRARENA